MKSVFKSIKKKFHTKAEEEQQQGGGGGGSPNTSPSNAAAHNRFKEPNNGNGNGNGNGNINKATANDSIRGSLKSPAQNRKTSEPLALPVRRNSRVDEQLTGEQKEVTKADLLKPIPSLDSSSNKQALFIQKLRLCSITFDWTDDVDGLQKDTRAKEVKRQQLLELVEFIGMVKNKAIFTEPDVLVEVVAMVSANLFRALPPTIAQDTGEAEEDEEPVFEPSWPHLQIVYEFFLRFIVSSDVDVKTLKKHINASFVLNLLSLFDSQDNREREYLKTILHRIYAKFMSLRAFIRKAINHVFFVFIYETEQHNGIAELLEILGSIINGFALPLKAEHKTFLEKVLTPLHKVRGLASFHPQLAYCVTQFVDKDPTLSVHVVAGLTRYWPQTNSAKEVLFLNELEELLELTQPEEFKQMLPFLFRRLGKEIRSPHFQVAERALFLWQNEYIFGLIAENRRQILPIIFPALQHNTKHWNPTVNSLTASVLQKFSELDPVLLQDCEQHYREDLPHLENRRTLMCEHWQALEHLS
jgi:serine/threonine-protein phosphatase 2A regulatory subunit B'